MHLVVVGGVLLFFCGGEKESQPPETWGVCIGTEKCLILLLSVLVMCFEGFEQNSFSRYYKCVFYFMISS